MTNTDEIVQYLEDLESEASDLEKSESEIDSDFENDDCEGNFVHMQVFSPLFTYYAHVILENFYFDPYICPPCCFYGTD